VALAFLSAASPARGEAPKCVVYGDLTHLDYPLTRTARELAAGKPLRIVAIGSSSTAGAGATKPEFSYPAQLEQLLRARYPHNDVRVTNLGQNGIDIDEMLKQIDKVVADQNPQLLLAQMGTNTVLREESLTVAEDKMKEMLKRMRAKGVDVILVDQQYAPKVNERKNSIPMLGILENLSEEFGYSVFRRHTMMQRWHLKEGIGFEITIHPDQLHMNNWSYGCWARNLGAALSRLLAQPVPAIALHGR